MTKPDDKRVPAYKLPMEFLAGRQKFKGPTVQKLLNMERAVEVLAELRQLEDEPSWEFSAKRRELHEERNRLLTELEVEVKRG